MAGAKQKDRSSGMEAIREDIRGKQFRRVYLLYGEERYLVQQYRNELIRAVCGDKDSMNLNIHREESLNFGAIQDEILAMPFFAQYRMVVLDDTKLFRARRKGLEETEHAEEVPVSEDAPKDPMTEPGADLAGSLAAFLPKIPESSVVLFTEQPDEKKPGGEKGKASVDKRGRLFKAVVKCGLAVEFSAPDEKMLRKWVLGKLGAEKIRITGPTLETFLAMTGNDMSHISTECEKLISYAGRGGTIRTEDVEIVTSEILEGKIFRMLDLIVQHERGPALALYHDLIAIKEPPARIFILLMRQFDRLLLVRSILDEGGSTGKVMEVSGMPGWQADKSIRQARRFEAESLRQIVEQCADLQERAQSGKIDMRLALELLIIRTSA